MRGTAALPNGIAGTGAGALALALLGLLAFSAGASAGGLPGSVTMFSDPQDWIGGGHTYEFDAANAQLSMQGTASRLDVYVSGGASAKQFTFTFAAPSGQALAPGDYPHTQRADFATAGHPGMDIRGDGHGCNQADGGFEVRDIHTDAGGHPDRLWIIYEQHCDGAGAALFGELKIGEPAPTSILTAEPSSVRWPPVDPGLAGTPVPVTLVGGPAGASIASANLSGGDARDFTLSQDGCSGHTLSAGQTCQVWVGATSLDPGVRQAALILTGSDGAQYSVPLQALAHGGTSSATFNSDAGDYIGSGQNFSYGAADGLTVRATNNWVSYALATGWRAEFAAPPGGTLAPGTYPGAQRYPYNASSPGLDVSGQGRGCNTLTGQFSVSELTFFPDGTLDSFGGSFEQHCEGATAALRGTLRYRVGDSTPEDLYTWGAGQSSPAGSNASPTGPAAGASPAPASTLDPTPNAHDGPPPSSVANATAAPATVRRTVLAKPRHHSVRARSRTGRSSRQRRSTRHRRRGHAGRPSAPRRHRR